MAGVDHVVAKGYVDESRLGVTGGSAGGLLTNWIIAHTNRFAAAVSMRPVINWHSFVGTTDGPSWYNQFEKYPWEDPMIYAVRSPLHYVVYSRVYRSDGSHAWVGTTPGYYGTMVGSDGTVVYGTGYAYPPYVGTTVYVCYPSTYGYGCNPCWTPWVGWSFGFAAGWAMAEDWYWWNACPPAPYWGPYWYPCYGAYYNAYGGITAWGPYGWAGTTGYIYHENGPWTGVSRGAAG